jgi:hypothetical protein
MLGTANASVKDIVEVEQELSKTQSESRLSWLAYGEYRHNG